MRVYENKYEPKVYTMYDITPKWGLGPFYCCFLLDKAETVRAKPRSSDSFRLHIADK